MKRGELLFSKTVDGQLPSMKNQRELVTNRRTGKPMFIKSKEALAYHDYFLLQTKKSEKIGYDGPVSLRCRVWYKSRRNDLDIEFLKDLLAHAEIIKNDRQIVHMEAWKGVDRDKPRVVFTIYKYEPPEELK